MRAVPKRAVVATDSYQQWAYVEFRGSNHRSCWHFDTRSTRWIKHLSTQGHDSHDRGQRIVTILESNHCEPSMGKMEITKRMLTIMNKPFPIDHELFCAALGEQEICANAIHPPISSRTAIQRKRIETAHEIEEKMYSPRYPE